MLAAAKHPRLKGSRVALYSRAHRHAATIRVFRPLDCQVKMSRGSVLLSKNDKYKSWGTFATHERTMNAIQDDELWRKRGLMWEQQLELPTSKSWPKYALRTGGGIEHVNCSQRVWRNGTGPG